MLQDCMQSGLTRQARQARGGFLVDFGVMLGSRGEKTPKNEGSKKTAKNDPKKKGEKEGRDQHWLGP